MQHAEAKEKAVEDGAIDGVMQILAAAIRREGVKEPSFNPARMMRSAALRRRPR